MTPRPDLEHRIRALAPWFHNLVLDGIATAPDRFRFAVALAWS